MEACISTIQKADCAFPIVCEYYYIILTDYWPAFKIKKLTGAGIWRRRSPMAPKVLNESWFRVKWLVPALVPDWAPKPGWQQERRLWLKVPGADWCRHPAPKNSDGAESADKSGFWGKWLVPALVPNGRHNCQRVASNVFLRHISPIDIINCPAGSFILLGTAIGFIGYCISQKAVCYQFWKQPLQCSALRWQF